MAWTPLSGINSYSDSSAKPERLTHSKPPGICRICNTVYRAGLADDDLENIVFGLCSGCYEVELDKLRAELLK